MIALSIILSIVIVAMILWFNCIYKPRIHKEIMKQIEPYVTAAIDPELYLCSLILEMISGMEKGTVVDFSMYEEKGIIYMTETIPKITENSGPIFIKNAVVYNTPKGWLCKF